MKLTPFTLGITAGVAHVAIETRDQLVLAGANDVSKSSVLRCLQLVPAA